VVTLRRNEIIRVWLLTRRWRRVVMSVSRLAVDDRGNGPAIVLLHGLTFSGETWTPIAEALLPRHRVITVDLPGHGESDGSAADPRAVVDRLHATLTAQHVHRPVVVGHSAGALLATGYASVHPTRGVVNVDQPLLVAPFAAFVQQFGAALRGPDFSAAFAPFERGIGVDRLPEPERTRVASTRDIRQDVVLDHWQLPLKTPPDALQATVDAMLDAITVPYLYLAGDILPAPVREHLQVHLQRPQIEIWPGLGHVVHLAEPKRFATLITDFAASASAASTGIRRPDVPAPMTLGTTH
jgi:pimeloyl-ACP methyl ester carboxylesterase